MKPKVRPLVLEKKTQEEIVEKLNKADPMLRRLSIHHSKLKYFPKKILEFTELKKLSLFNTYLESLPSELYLLHNLEDFRVTGRNPVNKSSDVKTGEPLVTLFRNFKKLKLHNTKRQIQTALLVNNQTYLETKTSLEILEGTLPQAHQSIQRNAMAMLEKKLPNLLENINTELGKINLLIWGKLKSISERELKSFAKTHGFAVNGKTPPTHILIGDDWQKADTQFLKANDIPWVLPQHLTLFMEILETPHLKTLGEQGANNLKEWILSDDASNQKLALEMLKKGGIPENMLFFLVAVSLDKYRANSSELFKFLQKHLDADTHNILARVRSRYSLDKVYKLLPETGFINKMDLAKELFFLHERGIIKYGMVDTFYVLTRGDLKWFLEQITNQNEMYWYKEYYWRLFKRKVNLKHIEVLHINAQKGALELDVYNLEKFTGLKKICAYLNDGEILKEIPKKHIQQKFPELEIIERPNQTLSMP